MQKCAILFDGNLSESQDTKEFFKNNFYYTTIVGRMFRGIDNDVITLNDLYEV